MDDCELTTVKCSIIHRGNLSDVHNHAHKNCACLLCVYKYCIAGYIVARVAAKYVRAFGTRVCYSYMVHTSSSLAPVALV